MSDEKNLWGGRFTTRTDPGFADFNQSFSFDRRLFEVDIRASIAHSHALVGAGVLTKEECDRVVQALTSLLEQAKADPDYFDKWPQEDIHTFVEAHLFEVVGEAGHKLHTGRSRNDQVATDLRMWLRGAFDNLQKDLQSVQEALLEFAEANAEVTIPGYTHLQKAQPVLLAHWCLAYFEMFMRDRERLRDARQRVNVMPLGAAAIAGTTYAIDREAVARELGFEGIARNSMDAVSDRDFCVEFVSACALVMVHLSRLAEDIILYTSAEFGFFELGEAVATGSSLMPQKKNPDSLELVRGKSGRVFGDLQTLLTMLKGLPLTYNKDMQEDKEAVFDAFDTVQACAAVTATVLGHLAVNRQQLERASACGYMNATELADYLVRKGAPFREAHAIVGKIVLHAIEHGVELQQLSLPVLQRFSSLIESDVIDALSLESTLSSKGQLGGTSPERVSAALSQARERLREA